MSARWGEPQVDPDQLASKLSKIIRHSTVDATKSVREQLAKTAEAASAGVLQLFEANALSSTFNFDGLLTNGVLAELREAAITLGETVRRRMPPNWPADADWEQIITVIQEDGIPLVWVPRREIVAAVVAAPTRLDRHDIVLHCTAEIAADCRAALAEVADLGLVGQVALATSAVDAFEAGHYQAAQALAVVVTETAIAATIDGSYKSVKSQVKVSDLSELTVADLRLRAALVPVGRFYTPWWPSSGTAPPESLSRHVSVHQADVNHYTRINAHLSILLVASVLPALAEFRRLAPG